MFVKQTRVLFQRTRFIRLSGRGKREDPDAIILSALDITRLLIIILREHDFHARWLSTEYPLVSMRAGKFRIETDITMAPWDCMITL